MSQQTAVSEDGFVLKRVILSAPGKVILHGEHAVVYGKSAIATSVDLRCYLLLVPNSSGTVTLTLPDMKLCQSWQLSDVTELLSVAEDEHLEAIKSFCKAGSEPSMQSLACIILLYLLTRILKDKLRVISGLEVFIASHIPFGAGLGSSAAYSICIAAGLMVASNRVPAQYVVVGNSEEDTSLPIPLSDRVRELGAGVELCSYSKLPDVVLNEINRLGLEAEKLVHGTPSGIDNSISTFGGAIEFKGGVFNQIAKMPSLTVILVYTKVSRSTKKMVSTVRQKYNSYPQVIMPVLDSIDAIVTSCKSTLEELWELERGHAPSGDGHTPLDRMQLYQTLQELISVNHHLLNAVGVGHASLDRAFHIAMDNGLMCKTTGAGGGGCALVLVPPDTSDDVVSKVVREIHSVGFECWKTQVGSRGVAIHHCS